MVWPFSPSYPTHSPSNLFPEYDFIIVGGGTAGSVLANRLSSIPDTTTLLIERGGSSSSVLDVHPLLSQQFLSASKNSVVTRSEPNAEMLEGGMGKTFDMVAGKGLGGSSRINSMIYTRGTPGEYNKWSEDGRKGWSYEELKGYFIKSEKWTSSLEDGGDHHGTDGEWQVRTLPKVYSEYSAMTALASDKIGIKILKDGNSPLEPSIGTHATTQYTMASNGHRHSAFNAFLPKPLVEEREKAGSLHICTESIVGKIVVENHDRGDKDRPLRAGGVVIHPTVEKSSGFNSITIRARKEVIIACGALRSPQVLMLSGIGPADHLKEIGINPLKDLPGVGGHLQDHIGTHLHFSCPVADSLLCLLKQPTTLISQIWEYTIKGTGLMLGSQVETCIYARAKDFDEEGNVRGKDGKLDHDATEPGNVPDIEIMVDTIADFRPPIFSSPPHKGRGVVSLMVTLLKPKSLGTVRLATKSPHSEPLFDMRPLTHPDDIKILRTGTRFALQIRKVMKEEMGYDIRDAYVPEGGSDEELDKFIRGRTTSMLHYSSTCRMAPEFSTTKEGGGVLDDELRVYGVEGLRVADASVFPEVLGAHLQAPVVMVAEKCADMIRRRYE